MTYVGVLANSRSRALSNVAYYGSAVNPPTRILGGILIL
jgi:hypothetical protein